MAVYLGQDKVDMLGGQPIIIEGTDTSDATATAGDIRKDMVAYVDGERIVGTIPNCKSTSWSINVDDDGVVNAKFWCNENCYVYGNEYYTKTKQLDTQASKTITPGTTAQTAVANGLYTIGDVTVAGDANLVSANIKSGVSIFGVTGNSKVVDTSDGTAVAGDILKDKTVYVNGQKITGTLQTYDGTVS